MQWKARAMTATSEVEKLLRNKDTCTAPRSRNVSSVAPDAYHEREYGRKGSAPTAPRKSRLWGLAANATRWGHGGRAAYAARQLRAMVADSARRRNDRKPSMCATSFMWSVCHTPAGARPLRRAKHDVTSGWRSGTLGGGLTRRFVLRAPALAGGARPGPRSRASVP